jgi:membrane-associated phospholipid phosphatase
VWRHGIAVLEYAIGLPVFKLLSVVVLIAGMLVVMVVPRWRRYAPTWMLIAGTHVFSRFLTPLIKDLTGRLRPHEWLAKDGDQTFWSGGAAFPSGHVSLFASIVIPLAVVVPRTRPLLVVVGFVMLARVAVNSHWASDVLAAITLVTLVCWVLGQAVRPLRT